MNSQLFILLALSVQLFGTCSPLRFIKSQQGIGSYVVYTSAHDSSGIPSFSLSNSPSEHEPTCCNSAQYGEKEGKFSMKVSLEEAVNGRVGEILNLPKNNDLRDCKDDNGDGDGDPPIENLFSLDTVSKQSNVRCSETERLCGVDSNVQTNKNILIILQNLWHKLFEVAPNVESIENALQEQISVSIDKNNSMAAMSVDKQARLYRQLLGQFLEPLTTRSSGGGNQRSSPHWLDQEFVLNLKGTAVLAQHPELVQQVHSPVLPKLCRGIRIVPSSVSNNIASESEHVSSDGAGSENSNETVTISADPPGPSGLSAVQDTLVRALSHSLGANLVYLNLHNVNRVRDTAVALGVPSNMLSKANIIRALLAKYTTTTTTLANGINDDDDVPLVVLLNDDLKWLIHNHEASDVLLQAMVQTSSGSTNNKNENVKQRPQDTGSVSKEDKVGVATTTSDISSKNPPIKSHLLPDHQPVAKHVNRLLFIAIEPCDDTALRVGQTAPSCTPPPPITTPSTSNNEEPGTSNSGSVNFNELFNNIINRLENNMKNNNQQQQMPPGFPTFPGFPPPPPAYFQSAAAASAANQFHPHSRAASGSSSSSSAPAIISRSYQVVS